MMKNRLNYFFETVICLALLLCPITVFAAEQTDWNPIIIDGHYDDWQDKPSSLEVKNNDQNTPDNYQHKNTIALFRNEEEVYLYVKVNENYNEGVPGKGLEYQFWCDGRKVTFQITPMEELGLELNELPAGRHRLNVEYESQKGIVEGAIAYITCNEDRVADQIEMSIPFLAFSEMDNKIEQNRINTIEFYNPNLTHRKVACVGTDTGPYIGIALVLLAGFAGFWQWTKKGRRRK